jgi:N-acetylmuramoyl-L-alanine amidase
VTTLDAYESVMLALAGWREARGESDAAILGVLWVIRNRAADPRWPDRLSEVVLYRKRPGVKRQFSSFEPGDPNAALLPQPDDPAWVRCCLLVDGLMQKNIESTDPTGGANHYHSFKPGATGWPAWATEDKQTARIGPFWFYRL